MGVPAFFRWLSRRCGAIVVNCVEEEPKTVDGVTIPGQSPNLRFLGLDPIFSIDLKIRLDERTFLSVYGSRNFV